MPQALTAQVSTGFRHILRVTTFQSEFICVLVFYTFRKRRK